MVVLLVHLVGGCDSNNAAASGDIVSWKVMNNLFLLYLVQRLSILQFLFGHVNYYGWEMTLC